MKTVLITGCSSGVGYASAQLLKKQGYIVYATARKQKDVDQLQQEGFKSCLLDLNKFETIKKTIKTIMHEQGRIDIVFQNGAYGQGGAIEDIPTQALIDQFNTNVFGWHELNFQVLPIMKKQGHGKIILNSSVLGLVTLPFRGAYVATKFAIEALSDTLRIELQRDKNIHIILIEPGPITSQFRQNAIEKLQEWVDIDASRFKAGYLKRIESENHNKTQLFKLPAHAVAQKVLKAIASKKPKIRYYVTQPTYVLSFLKRVLPDQWLDVILHKIGTK